MFFKFGQEIWLKSKVSKKIGPWNWGMDFHVALITFSIDFLVALNTKHEFFCCSKYHSMSFLFALNTNSIGFLVALTTHSMNIFVALRWNFQREHCDLWTFHKPNFFNYWVYMNILTKCKLIVKEKKSWDCTFKFGH